MEHQDNQTYTDDFKRFPPCSEDEASRLLTRLLMGDKSAIDRLVEAHLNESAAAVGKQGHGGILTEDLLQEANLGLFLAVSEFQGLHYQEELEQADDFYRMVFLPYIRDGIQSAIQKAVEEQREQEKNDEELTARANVLQEVSRVMAQELGREATIEELASKMRMTQEELRGIMKMTLDAVQAETSPVGQ